MPKLMRAAAPAACVLIAASHLNAQRGGNDWMTVGNDVQRSNWVRGDAKISAESMRKPGFQMLWKLKLAAAGKQLTPPVLLDFFIGHRGFRTLGFFGSADKIIGVDTDLARIEWEKPLAPAAAATSPLCPGGMTAPVTRPANAGYLPMGARGAGRGNPAKSGVGAANEGAVTLNRQPQPPFMPLPAPAAAGRRPMSAPPNPFGRQPLFVGSIAADGSYHQVYVSNGEEPATSTPFLPAGANATGLMVFDGHVYAATINGCGGADNGVWALNLQSKQVSKWKAPANIAGTLGVAAGPDGVIYVAAGDEVTALAPGTLAPKGSYKAGSALASTPVVFEYKGKDVIAVATADGSLHIFDGESMGKALFKTPASKPFQAGALASWQDWDGGRWVLAPTASGIAAWKVVEKNGGTALETAWSSRAMTAPLPPSVVNGVVFAVSRSPRAVLYALDSATGKEVWDSGAAIASPVAVSGLSAGGGRVYVAGTDGTQYAFGFPMEH